MCAHNNDTKTLIIMRSTWEREMTIFNTCVKCNKLLIQLWTNSLRAEGTATNNVCRSYSIHDSMEQHRGVALNWLEPAFHNCTSLTISLCMATRSHNINADETSAMSAQQSNKRKLDPCHVAKQRHEKTTGCAIDKELTE